MKNIYKIVIGVLVVIVIMVVVRGQEKAHHIVIGAILPLTGGLASVGEDLQNGMKLALEGTNREVEIVDGQANPQTSLSAARQLVDVKKADIILTAFRGATLSVASALTTTDVVVFSTTATAEGKNVSTSTPNLYVMGAEIIKSAKVVGEYAQRNNLCKRIGLLSEQTDAGKDKLDGFAQNYQSSEVISRDFFDPASTDFRTIIAKLKSQKIDCVFAEIRSNSLPVLLKQFEENQFHPKIFSTSYSVTPGILKDSPSPQLENIIFSSTLVSEENPLTQAFLETYKNKYGKTATDFSVIGYEMIKITMDALDACVDDVLCVKNKLGGINNRASTLGVLTMKSNREIQLTDYDLFKITDNKFVKVK